MSIVSAVVLCTLVGAVGAIILVAASKFMAVEEDPRIEEVGPPAAHPTRASSVQNAARRSRRACPSISATSAAGSLPTPPSPPSSARNAAIPLTMATSFDQTKKKREEVCERCPHK